MSSVFVSSRLLNNKCLYSCCKVKNNEVIDNIVGEFNVQRPNKGCLYASDLVLLKDKSDKDVTFYYDTKEAFEYVGQMRPKYKMGYSPDSKWFKLNETNLINYIKEKYPHFNNIFSNLER